MGKTRHSTVQVEHCKNKVNNKSMNLTGGKQCIETNDGCISLLNVNAWILGCSQHRMEQITPCVMTSDKEWDSLIVYHSIADVEKWYDAFQDMVRGDTNSPFDLHGECRPRCLIQMTTRYQIRHMWPRYCATHTNGPQTPFLLTLNLTLR